MHKKFNKIMLLCILVLVGLVIFHSGITSYYGAIGKGTSMEPTFHDGDYLIIIPPHNIQIGDIIAYETPRMHRAIHRVVSVHYFDGEGSHIYTQSDNITPLISHRVEPEQVLGEVVFYIPRQIVIVMQVAGIIMLGIVGTMSLVEDAKWRKKK